ncbi:uncharacterized protein LOC126899814 isoform X4 [Daktulosphaira vitifoliae]|uniref:uncharacterized protein LOC126899814 isoform X2 n=1 Tax=Daktulosphaira vitifoliae TaxID=58002 RepID=UPI0021A9F065|nr:uncharacterized protein LOC126899814 isoform X2 [Daktulosphaira vitifoliae]XP_050531011.1 uncharacterized protein LOC126899814 isoform X3 [Daktulosphaira vitifoliae]XP_050531020.1 uncharacterized protein LOC126899814 isoform X4 [Daktulosphaira vitifoliae]
MDLYLIKILTLNIFLSEVLTFSCFRALCNSGTKSNTALETENESATSNTVTVLETNNEALETENESTTSIFIYETALEIENEDCPICACELSSVIRKHDYCGRKFHNACIFKWIFMKYNPTCPNCRKSLTNTCIVCKHPVPADNRFIYQTTCCKKYMCNMNRKWYEKFWKGECKYCNKIYENVCSDCKNPIPTDNRYIYQTQCCEEYICNDCRTHHENTWKGECKYCKKIYENGLEWKQTRVPVTISIRATPCRICYKEEAFHSFSSECSHWFCKECLENSLQKKNYCPICYEVYDENYENI